MKNQILSLTALVTASVAFIFPFQPKAEAQEYPGCYVVRPSGRLVDLDPLCTEDEMNQEQSSSTPTNQAARSDECQALLVAIEGNLQPDTETVTYSSNDSPVVQFQADVDNTISGLNEFNQDLENLELEDPNLIQSRSSLIANNDNISESLSIFAENAIAQNEPERLPEADVLQTEINEASGDIIEDIEAYCIGSNNDNETAGNEIEGIQTEELETDEIGTDELDTESPETTTDTTEVEEINPQDAEINPTTDTGEVEQLE